MTKLEDWKELNDLCQDVRTARGEDRYILVQRINEKILDYEIKYHEKFYMNRRPKDDKG